jgi:hypothetical protein
MANPATGEATFTVPYHRRMLAVHEEALGPQHPTLAQGLFDLALLLWRQGEVCVGSSLV